MKKGLTLIAIFSLIITGAIVTTGVVRLIIIFFAFPIVFIFCPMLFMTEKEAELTDEAKIEKGLMKKKSIYDEENEKNTHQ